MGIVVYDVPCKRCGRTFTAMDENYVVEELCFACKTFDATHTMILDSDADDYIDWLNNMSVQQLDVIINKKKLWR